jgi:hypothetical protein
MPISEAIIEIRAVRDDLQGVSMVDLSDPAALRKAFGNLVSAIRTLAYHVEHLTKQADER